MQIGDLVKSNYPDMSGAIGVIVELKKVEYWKKPTIQQYRIEWVTKNHQSIGIMWMTGESLERI